MFTLEEGLRQLEAYRQFRRACAVPQLKVMATRGVTEWKRATGDLAEVDDSGDYTIALLSEVVGGMMVPANEDGDCPVVRKMDQYGQMSLHLETRTGRSVYLNFVGPMSPVLVRSITIAPWPLESGPVPDDGNGDPDPARTAINANAVDITDAVT